MGDNQKKPKQVGAYETEQAVQAVKSMGIAEAHRGELKREFARGYHQALDDMRAKLDKMFPI